MNVIRQLRNSLQRSGIWSTARLCLRAVVFYAREQTPRRRRSRKRESDNEREYDRRFGVVTAGRIPLSKLTIPSSHRIFGSAYQATSPKAFAEMMARVPADLERFVFVDFGSGLGKVLLLASEYPFRSVIGVEFSPELHRRACENVRRYASGTQQCKDVVSICQDAAEFQLPRDPLILYFYLPFLENLMKNVIDRVAHSLREDPREAFIVYYNPELSHVIDGSKLFRLVTKTATYNIYQFLVR